MNRVAAPAAVAAAPPTPPSAVSHVICLSASFFMRAPSSFSLAISSSSSCLCLSKLATSMVLTADGCSTLGDSSSRKCKNFSHWVPQLRYLYLPGFCRTDTRISCRLGDGYSSDTLECSSFAFGFVLNSLIIRSVTLLSTMPYGNVSSSIASSTVLIVVTSSGRTLPASIVQTKTMRYVPLSRSALLISAAASLRLTMSDRPGVSPNLQMHNNQNNRLSEKQTCS
jgi:hypothetical protein